jgi:hypothetical protein
VWRFGYARRYASKQATRNIICIVSYVHLKTRRTNEGVSRPPSKSEAVQWHRLQITTMAPQRPVQCTQSPIDGSMALSRLVMACPTPVQPYTDQGDCGLCDQFEYETLAKHARVGNCSPRQLTKWASQSWLPQDQAVRYEITFAVLWAPSARLYYRRRPRERYNGH